MNNKNSKCYFTHGTTFLKPNKIAVGLSSWDPIINGEEAQHEDSYSSVGFCK